MVDVLLNITERRNRPKVTWDKSPFSAPFLIAKTTMKIYHLEADRPLTKSYSLDLDGHTQKTSYLHAREFSSHMDEVTSIDELFTCIRDHALLGHCLLKGQLSRPLVHESRAGTTTTDSATEWICLDFDGLPPTYTPDQILQQLGIGNIDYILQWSASQGVTTKELRFHVFMLLGSPTAAPHLKQWLIHLNHTVPFLRDNIQLQASKVGLRWGLDTTTCQNDKLIYTAPPILEGIRSPMTPKQRYQLVKKAKRRLTLPASINTAEQNKALTEERINELRSAEGLPTRRFTFKLVQDMPVLVNPGEATITGQKQERGFMYFNLNGGDSWAYYHPEEDATFIYSFKGEGPYLTSQLLPDYWKGAKRLAKTKAPTNVGAHAQTTVDPIHLTFRDRNTGVYWHGTYDEQHESFNLSVAKNEKQVRDYCTQYGLPIGDHVPLWNMTFDPSDNVALDVQNKTINLFQRSKYMRAEPKRVTQCPTVIFKLISHVLGGKVDHVEHFINWLAFIVQQRTRTETGWVIYGTEGTGKGLLMNKVLRPLFEPHMTVQPTHVLHEKYTAYLRNQLIVCFDEAHIPNMKNAEAVLERLRQYITEATVSIRAMYATAIDMPNYANFILASNKPDAITLRPNDRRWNVSSYQNKKLTLSAAEHKILDDGTELQNFYHYLYDYPVDTLRVRVPVKSEDREQLVNTTLSSPEKIAQALAPGEATMDFFLGELPPDNGYMSNAVEMNRVEDYRATLLTLIERTDDEGLCRVTDKDLKAIFAHCTGMASEGSIRFRSYLARSNIHVRRMRMPGREDRPYGIEVTWTDHAKFKKYLNTYWPTKFAASLTPGSASRKPRARS